MGGGIDPAVSAASVGGEGEDAEAAFLRRLQSQFGDMDLSGLDEGAGGSAGGGGESPSGEDRKGDDGGGDAGADVDADADADSDIMDGGADSESTPEEPSPEEVMAWQEAQYKLARWANEAKRKGGPSSSLLRKERAEDKKGGGDHCEGWETLHPPPDLDGQESAFFPPANASRYVDEDDKDSDVDVIDRADAGRCNGGINPFLAKLAGIEPDILGGKWQRLYSSTTDGLSFRHLLVALRGYDGPTVLLIGTSPSAKHSRYLRSQSSASSREGARRAGEDWGRGTIGFFTASKWRELPNFHGTDDCFLFSFSNVSSDLRAIRPSSTSIRRAEDGTEIPSKKGNYMYLSPKPSPSHAQPNDPSCSYGLGVGGTRLQPRLHITESLEGCRALPWDGSGSFEEGELLPNPDAESADGASNKEGKGEREHDSLFYFDVSALEVWGVGGPKWISSALSSRTAERERDEALRRRVSTVDKAQFLDDFRTGLISGAVNGDGLFGHTEQVMGRVDVCGGAMGDGAHDVGNHRLV